MTKKAKLTTSWWFFIIVNGETLLALRTHGLKCLSGTSSTLCSSFTDIEAHWWGETILVYTFLTRHQQCIWGQKAGLVFEEMLVRVSLNKCIFFFHFVSLHPTAFLTSVDQNNSKLQLAFWGKKSRTCMSLYIKQCVQSSNNQLTENINPNYWEH